MMIYLGGNREKADKSIMTHLVYSLFIIGFLSFIVESVMNSIFIKVYIFVNDIYM